MKVECIYLSLRERLNHLVHSGNKKATVESIEPGELKYLLAEAIADALYDKKD